MITNIKTKSFKGFDINEEVHEKTIYSGKNKSGKSSRSHAIALTILGYVPFAAKTSKIASNILNDFGTGDAMTTAITCNGVEFERHFSRNKEGSVSQRMRVDKTKVSATDYAVALSHAGNPRIVDVNDFMMLSDQKKIDLLFTLFPPETDIKGLENKIDRAKQTANELQAQERTLTSVIQRLTASKSATELPSGSLPEIRAQIEKLTGQVKEAQENLKNIEIEEAKETAKAEQKKSSQADFDKIMKDKTVPWVAGNDKPAHTREEVEKMVEFVRNDFQPQIDREALKSGHLAKQAIHKIIDTMQDAGCETCASLIVAKMELRRFK